MVILLFFNQGAIMASKEMFCSTNVAEFSCWVLLIIYSCVGKARGGLGVEQRLSLVWGRCVAVNRRSTHKKIYMDAC